MRTIMEKHIRGGLTPVETNELGLLVKDYTLHRLEERIIIYAIKEIQEVTTLSVFVPFSLFYLKEPLKPNYLWAGLCLMGAVFFIIIFL